MRGRRFVTEADIERHISNGFGQGAGSSYLPWLRVQDVPSQGRSRKVQGIKVDRLHHLFSNLEYAHFLIFEFSEDIVDIREQYPLLSSAQTQAIANAMGLRHPRYPKTALPYVMTTDFLLTVKNPDGSFRSVARTVKYSSDLQGKEACRTIEKLEIERRFWMAQDVDWATLTEDGLTSALTQNLGMLRKFANISRPLSQSALQDDFLGYLQDCRIYQWDTSYALKKIAAKLFIPYQESRALYHNLIWNKRIKLDLNTPLQMGAPLPDLTVIQDIQQTLKISGGAL